MYDVAYKSGKYTPLTKNDRVRQEKLHRNLLHTTGTQVRFFPLGRMRGPFDYLPPRRRINVANRALPVRLERFGVDLMPNVPALHPVRSRMNIKANRANIRAQIAEEVKARPRRNDLSALKTLESVGVNLMPELNRYDQQRKRYDKKKTRADTRSALMTSVRRSLPFLRELKRGVALKKTTTNDRSDVFHTRKQIPEGVLDPQKLSIIPTFPAGTVGSLWGGIPPNLKAKLAQRRLSAIRQSTAARSIQDATRGRRNKRRESAARTIQRGWRALDEELDQQLLDEQLDQPHTASALKRNRSHVNSGSAPHTSAKRAKSVSTWETSSPRSMRSGRARPRQRIHGKKS